MNLQKARLEDQIAQVQQDLAELDLQVADGELDEETAAALRETYERELETLRSSAAPDEDIEERGRSVSRMVAGTIAALAVAVGVTFALTRAIEDRPEGGFATGGVVTDAAFGAGRDLSTVTNEELEQVIADNPDIVPMRLALARRYFEAGEFDRALPHYLAVLDREEHPEALANVGWMTYLSDRPDLAAPFVERAIELDPDYLPAYWFLANIRLDGLGDAAGAVAPLERIVTSPDVPDDVRAEAQRLLDQARRDS